MCYGPVIAGEDEQRVLFREFVFVQSAQDLADGPVEFVDKIAVHPDGTCSLESGIRDDRSVHIAKGNVKEKRFLGFRFQPGYSLFRQFDGQVFVVVEGSLAACKRVGGHKILAVKIRPAVFLSRVQHDLERRIRPESDDMVVLDIHMRILPDEWDAVKVVEPDLEGPGFKARL